MIVAKADSAATNHYWRDADLQSLTNIQNYAGPSVTLLNNENIFSKEQGLIPISKQFGVTARTATNLPHLKSSLLLATGPLCDDGKVVLFDQDKVHVMQRTAQYDALLNTLQILHNGSRNRIDGC